MLLILVNYYLFSNDFIRYHDLFVSGSNVLLKKAIIELSVCKKALVVSGDRSLKDASKVIFVCSCLKASTTLKPGADH